MKQPPFYVTDAHHFLDERGLTPDDIPGPAKRLIQFMSHIIEELTMQPPGLTVPIGANCLRRPERKACQGKILAWRDAEESAIFWKCDQCGTGGQISNWKNTQWDNSMESVH